MTSLQQNKDDHVARLEDVPVQMPELPAKLTISTVQQFKAIGDPVRTRILGIIQHQPATAKQIADKLQASPGNIGHHLQILEAAGLARVVARRLVHGIVAKYYTRTARIFVYDFPPEVKGNTSTSLDFVTHARDELAETLVTEDEKVVCQISFPHVRLSPEQVKVYDQRLRDLVNDFLNERPDPHGQVYGLFATLFKSPAYLQDANTAVSSEIPTEDR